MEQDLIYMYLAVSSRGIVGLNEARVIVSHLVASCYDDFVFNLVVVILLDIEILL